MIRRMVAAACALALSTQTADAKMLVASSPHFTVYADQDEPSLRRFAEELEGYDAVLRALTGVKADGDDIVPLTVHVRGDEYDVGGGYGVLGYYYAAAAGAFAVVPRKLHGFGVDSIPRIVLFHEYAHHFTYQNFPSLYAPWCVEGLAEFYSTVELGDGTATIGRPEPLRVRTLNGRWWTTLRHLLSPGDRPLTGGQTDELYARAWLLVHYLTLSKQRGGQIDGYLRARARHGTEEAAFRAALGTTVSAMDEELRRYYATRTLGYGTVQRPPTAAVAIRDATPGEAAADKLLPWLRILQTARDGFAPGKEGANDRRQLLTDARRLVGKARAQARKFAEDPTVQLLLAESEAVAGNYGEARAAAERTLRLSPANARAHLVLAEATLAAAPAGDAAALAAARGEIVRANHAAPNDPLPLIANYRSYAGRGTPVPPRAIDGLYRAHQLAPQDNIVRILLAGEWIAAKRFAPAATLLRPVAFSPHDSPARKQAQALLASVPNGGDEAPPPPAPASAG